MVNEHLHEIGPMWLVVRKVEVKLDCAADPELVSRDEQCSLARRHGMADTTPEIERSIAREGRNEPDRRSPRHAVYEHVAQALNVLLREDRQSLDEVLSHGVFLLEVTSVTDATM
jgi:hypothetical protein